ncbi:MAG TPA: outer membrane beta-barrel protein [Terracidiphilus sp.]|nr:outer membrane beta-barrel protein [Terracidiphilus sp.]
MRLKPAPSLIAAALFLAVTLPISAQTAPAAEQGGIPIVVGAGLSYFNLDWGSDSGVARTMDGPAAWVDWNLNRLPGLLSGFGIEADGRALMYDEPSSLQYYGRMRQYTFQGGAIYTWRHFKKFDPYVKALAGIGSIDFPASPPFPNYTHDTFTINSFAGGGEYDLYRPIWIRADWEYQFWHHTFGPNDLNPHGVTVGLAYNFGQMRFHRF